MKTTFSSFILLVLFTAIGCQQPCTKTTEQSTYAGDTIYTIRTYANCSDTLSYAQKQVKSDSSIVSEGNMLNGKKEGEWIYNGYAKRVLTYNAGIEVAAKEYDKAGNLRAESVLGTDSLYAEKQFYSNGKVEIEQFLTLDGYLTGHAIRYDSLGRKLAEGNHIPESCFSDTVYIESQEPPHDLKMTVIEELGGKHGPWIYYNFEGSIIDTINFDHGSATWTGNIVGKWRLKMTVNTSGNSADEKFLMHIPDFSGYEFTADGRMGAINQKDQTSNWGTFAWETDGQGLFVFDNTRTAHNIFLFTLNDLDLKFAIGNQIFYFERMNMVK